MSFYTVSSIGLSGMNAAALRQAAASSNIANTLSEKMQRAQVVQKALPDGGVAASLSRQVSGSDDLVRDIVEGMGAVYSFKANLISLRVADEMAGTALNLKG
jgi:flagellar basal body rod protein FlgC